MESKRTQKFINAQNIFQCPLCHKEMQVVNNSIYCKEKHCFDISAKGYINFIPDKADRDSTKGYDGHFFESRRKIMEAGFYQHIQDELVELVQNLTPVSMHRHIVDAGCGEGLHAKSIREKTGSEVFAFDYSREAVKIAARGGNDVCWFVADIANIPLADKSMDGILNIFTPANYSEFKRLLTDDGLIIKVIPGENHMAELRQSLKDNIQNETYSNHQVEEYFVRNFEIVEKLYTNKTFPVTEDIRKDLLKMSPLMFHVDSSNWEDGGFTDITIEGEILVGKKRI